MKKKLNDIQAKDQHTRINLGKNKKPEKAMKIKTSIAKKRSPIQKIQDISPPEQENQKYIYVSAKLREPSRLAASFIRVGMMGFLIVFLINTMSVYSKGKELEAEISAAAYEGYSYLVDAGKSASKIQFESALEAFDKAFLIFDEAKASLWFLSGSKTRYSASSSSTAAANAILEGGKEFAKAGSYFLEALEEFSKIPVYFIAKNENPDEDSPSITDALKVGLEKTDQALVHIKTASSFINSVPEDLIPADMKARVKFAKSKIDEIVATLESTSENFPALLKLLGDRYPHRYLILLQNNKEIRPSGGFIGSYAIVDVNEGYIEKLSVHDVYDIDNAYGPIIEPPEEFKAFTPNWRFRDANYSHDFPTSAKKLRWFLQKENGPSVDTIIAINQGLLQPLLDVTGPVQVGNFGKLDSENYNLLLSYIIEGKIWGKENPKHILKLFIPAFVDSLLKEKNLPALSSNLYKAVQQKHIMLYSSDEEIQALFDSANLTGRVHETADNEDYLAVINISAGGTKSDHFIEEKITHHTDIDKTGQVTNTLTIRRTHNWSNDTYLRWKTILANYGFSDMPDHLIDILGRGRNKSVMKIYVPSDTILLSQNGPKVQLKYDKELKKSYFLTTMEILAGESSEVTIKYQPGIRLDLSPAASYRLISEKQPGSLGSIFTKTLSTDSDLQNLAIHPQEARIDSTGDVTYATNLVYDRHFSGVWSK
ncbi:DUF4012 domain-containing protein [Candidatus Gracilibacteria bacterium]|nr:DUF4012 domain-containing protein [Candidatus Gracilibacteria bacterium]